MGGTPSGGCEGETACDLPQIRSPHGLTFTPGTCASASSPAASDCAPRVLLTSELLFAGGCAVLSSEMAVALAALNAAFCASVGGVTDADIMASCACAHSHTVGGLVQI